MAKLYTLGKPGLLWWERRDVIKPGTACGCARLKWPLKSRPTEQQPQGQCVFLHARPRSPIQNVAGKNCGEQKITLAIGTGPKREVGRRINSVVSRTKGKEATDDTGQIEFCLPWGTVWMLPPGSPGLDQLPTAMIMPQNKQSQAAEAHRSQH